MVTRYLRLSGKGRRLTLVEARAVVVAIETEIGVHMGDGPLDLRAVGTLSRAADKLRRAIEEAGR